MSLKVTIVSGLGGFCHRREEAHIPSLEHCDTVCSRLVLICNGIRGSTLLMLQNLHQKDSAGLQGEGEVGSVGGLL